jgi:CDP-diacylglycerol--glycerol-3-phosphate 3-phosphatidyltransferase
MNVPNTLTTTRFIAAAIVMAAMTFPFPFATSVAFFFFLAASITDYFDGKLARTKYGVTAFGTLMDPLADKVLVSAAFICFVGTRLPYEPDYSVIPAWIVVVVIAREFAVTGLRLLVAANSGVVMKAGNWGKLKTAWQMITITALFVLLAVRKDVFPFLPENAFAAWKGGKEAFLSAYDGFFVWTSWVLSAVVLLLTLASGWKYFAANWNLVKKEM